jgi:hypothetical protein
MLMSRHLPLLRNCPIRFQVLAISLLGVLAFAFVAAASWQAERIRADAERASDRAWRTELNVAHAGAAFEAARTVVATFASEPRAANLSAEEKALKEAEALLAQAHDDATPGTDEPIKEIARLVGVFQSDFTIDLSP